jgi:uncharacterized repeat protein (TIGR03806 family)
VPDLPDGFASQVVAAGFTGATAMAVAPDGRVFVCEQTGTLRVVKNGALLPAPALRLDVDSQWERGLIGITLDPRFADNGHLYVVYVSPRPFPHHVVSRFTLRGDAADPTSETILLEGDDQRTMGGAIPAGHQGGGIRFGQGGKLYVSLGEQTAGDPSQRLDTLLGKLLRLNPDGSIPPDNPFLDRTAGKYRAIWAYGLRNPFGLSVQPHTGRMFVNDVGASRWEEVNEAVRGANYGWPLTEGPTTDPRFRPPLYAYAEGPQQSITGGVFYDPARLQFPQQYAGRYFFADFMYGWLRTLDPADPWTAQPFASGLAGTVALELAPDGSLYVLERNAWVKDEKFKPNTGTLRRIFHVAGSGEPAPQVVRTPRDLSAAEGDAAALSVLATGRPPLRYDWLENGKVVAADTWPRRARPLSAGDDGLQAQCVVSNAVGSVKTAPATISVLRLRDPVPAAPKATRGLEVRSLEGTFPRMPAFDREPAVQTATAADLSLPERPDGRPFGASFRGMLQVDRDGLYTFTVHSSGAAKLLVAGAEVASVGLSRGPRDASGSVALKAGRHPLRLDFYHARGRPDLSVQYAGPDFIRPRPIPASNLWRAPDRPAAAPREPAITVHLPPAANDQPPRLSETGLFRSLADLAPEAGVVPYAVNAPQWLDGATVRRWIVLPGDATVTFSDRDPWGVPPGTVLVQHVERGGRKLETRVLILERAGRATASTYVWDADQADARLTTRGALVDLPPATDEDTAPRTWKVPAADDCRACHSPLAGAVLGLSTRQLNGPAAAGEVNQLLDWSRRGLFTRPVDADSLPKLPRLAAIGDERAPLELRVKSYLDANCAHCHRPGGARAAYDARFDTPLDLQRLLNTRPIASDLGVGGALLVAPGDRARSMLYQRMARRRDVFNMPPLDSQVADRAALEVVGRWIDSLPKSDAGVQSAR